MPWVAVFPLSSGLASLQQYSNSWSELMDPSQTLHLLTSALAPTLAPTQDVSPGEELVSISGHNSTMGYLCGSISLRLSSGRVIEYKGENATRTLTLTLFLALTRAQTLAP